MSINEEVMNNIRIISNAAKKGGPIYIRPYREPKVWGIGGIGEYWYGAEKGGKSSIAVFGSTEALLADVMDLCAEDILGSKVISSFGSGLPLVKILTPKSRLSVQFHDSKNELWVVTGIDRSVSWGTPSVIIGFSEETVRLYGKEVTLYYGKALETYGDRLNALILEMKSAGFEKLMDERKDVFSAAGEVIGDVGNDALVKVFTSFETARKELEKFYNYRKVDVGDVVAVASGTLHAAGPGIEIVEPQIPGPTQSLEDGTTYPVRYAFPKFADTTPGANKLLDVDRVGEMIPDVSRKDPSEVLIDADGVKMEKLPGGFSDKGLEVHRITIDPGSRYSLSGIESFHTLVTVSGKAALVINGESYVIPGAVPGGEMVIVPASAGFYDIVSEAGSQIIDTFSPV